MRCRSGRKELGYRNRSVLRVEALPDARYWSAHPKPCLGGGWGGFVLFPHPLLSLSRTLNRTLVVLDEQLIRYRYALGLLLFAVSYLLFRLALLVPALQG